MFYDRHTQCTFVSFKLFSTPNHFGNTVQHTSVFIGLRAILAYHDHNNNTNIYGAKCCMHVIRIILCRNLHGACMHLVKVCVAYTHLAHIYNIALCACLAIYAICPPSSICACFTIYPCSKCFWRILLNLIQSSVFVRSCVNSICLLCLPICYFVPTMQGCWCAPLIYTCCDRYADVCLPGLLVYPSYICLLCLPIPICACHGCWPAPPGHAVHICQPILSFVPAWVAGISLLHACCPCFMPPCTLLLLRQRMVYRILYF